ncbi:MAG TPA: MlaD family protein, partial [Pirellulaceae bacterium]|nr:MlaD family protein [Pirellulaceae bacterium]
AVPNPLQRKYTLYVGFPTAPGVTVDTPIRKDGVLIGRVSHVKLLDEGGVLVTLRIDSQYKLQKTDICRIANASILGDAVIEFVPSGRTTVEKVFLSDGDFRPDGIVAANPFEAFNVLLNLEKDMKTALRSIDAAGQEVAVGARNLNTVVTNNEDQLQRILATSETALSNFNTAMVTINGVVGDPELNAALKGSLKELPQMFADAQVTLTEARETLAGFKEMSTRANTNLTNIEKFTKPLGERGENIAQNLDTSVETISSLLEQLAEMSERLNNSDGTLGKLVKDDELYNRLNRAAASVEKVTRDARPIVDDLKVFAQKIADDPRQLGVKGALDKRPSGVGFNFSRPASLKRRAMEEDAIWIED